MKIIYILGFAFSFFLFLILNTSFASSSFACGVVLDSETISSDWANVIVYFEENKSDFTNCQVNPEKKFCCDLENISSIKSEAGKKVFAEVYDVKRDLSAGPVYVYLTDKGYDLFPDMIIENSIDFNISDREIFVNSPIIPAKLSSYNPSESLIYRNNLSGESEITLCEDCNSSDFFLSLLKGENTVYLTSKSNEEIRKEKKVTIYNLDYFETGLNIFCNACKTKKKFLYVPSNEEVIINLYFNSSDNISGEFLIYFPRAWIILNNSNLIDFSTSHQGVIEKIQNNSFFSVNYTVKLPKKIMKQDYFIYQKIGGQSKLTKIRSFQIKLFPFHKINSFEENYPNEVLGKSSSPKNPIVLDIQDNNLESVAIFPKSDVGISYSYVESKTKNKINSKEKEFNILTTLSENEIEKIFLVFKTIKDAPIEAYSLGKSLDLKKYYSDENYDYYSAYVYKKSPIIIKSR